MGYIWVTGYVLRLKFYTGFYMAQSAVDSSGLSYSGTKKGSHQWETVTMCGRYSETSPNAKASLEAWNSSVQVWLKRYVYNRMIDVDVSRGQKPNIERATWTTFAVSAFWHGFYPSYYTSFFMLWCQIEYGRTLFRAKNRLNLPRYVYAAMDFLVSSWGFSFAFVNHVMLDWNKSLVMYQSTYCIPIVIPLAISMTLKMSGLATKKRAPADKVNTIEAKKIQ